MTIEQTERTRLRRLPKRGVFDRASIYSILDEGLVCHIAFAIDGKPFVIPTGYARIGDRLVIHGSSASRMLRSLAEGIDVCVTVTLLDGLVLARSAFHHSVNYRSVMVFGKAAVVNDDAEKLNALEAFTEHMIPGRWDDVRPPNELEMKATTVLSMPIEEASAKVRSGPPIDDEEDYDLDVWAGVLPLAVAASAAIPDERNRTHIDVPAYLYKYDRGS